MTFAPWQEFAAFGTIVYDGRMGGSDQPRARPSKALAVFVVFAAGIALVVAGAAQPRDAREGGTFRFALPADRVTSIDPYLDNLPAMPYIFRATCASLLNYPDKPLPAGYKIVPELAERLPQITNRGKTYTFTVRQGYRFSTGAPVTARDVAATFMRVLDPKLDSPGAQYFLNIVGAPAFNAGKTTRLTGVTVRGNRVVVRLREAANFAAFGGFLCVLPAELPVDPGGARAPIPSAGPYTTTEYVPGRKIVVERNRFYQGQRPHHVDRFDVTLVNDLSSVLEAIEDGAFDSAWVQGNWEQSARLGARYGVNQGRFFVQPSLWQCSFPLNTSRPLFRNNARLRRAVNFALDRKALVREWGAYAGHPTDQYLPRFASAFRDERIYPLAKPDLRTARALARGHTRGGKAVFYTRDDTLGRAHGEIVRANLKKIGIDVEVKPIPTPLLFTKEATPGEPFDIGWGCWSLGWPDDPVLGALFDGRTIGPGYHSNFSHFNSPAFNRRHDEVVRLTGRAYRRAYGKLDVDLSRDAAPAVPIINLNYTTLVSARTGCVIVNPSLDLAAVCLK
jgi:peptide/nickel transport system substrate-binding protein